MTSLEETRERPIVWEEILAPAFRHMRSIVAVTLIGTTMICILVAVAPRTYKATAQLMIRPQRARVLVSGDEKTPWAIDRTAEQINSQVALLKTSALLREVLQEHPLPPRVEQRDHVSPGETVRSIFALPFTLPCTLYRRFHELPEASDLDNAVADVRLALSVNPVGRSDLIEVSYSGRDGAWAAHFVNLLVVRHIERYMAMAGQPAARNFYQEQGHLLGERYEEARAKLTAFSEREARETTVVSSQAIRDQLSKLELEKRTARSALAQTKAQEEFLLTELERLPATRNVETVAIEVEPDSVRFLRGEILKLDVERAKLLNLYAPTSVKLRDVGHQMESLRKLMKEERAKVQAGAGGTISEADPAYQALRVKLLETRTDAAAAIARVDGISTQITELKSKMTRIDGLAMERALLENELAVASQAHSIYRRKEEEARFSHALDESRIGNLVVVETATVPTTPETSNGLLAILIGCILSIAAGVGLAYTRDRLDPSIKSSVHANRVSGVRVLTVIPSAHE